MVYRLYKHKKNMFLAAETQKALKKGSVYFCETFSAFCVSVAFLCSI